MGLCKECRKVTSLFCFKHRVNVCEKCMVEKHPTCVVQTYLQWLQDCDFDPTCRVCGDNVENGMETIRLPCLHLLHLGCLDKYAKSFPPNTAPAGFTCPICTTSCVPARNQAGPVANTARAQLSRLSWARIQTGDLSTDLAGKVATTLSRVDTNDETSGSTALDKLGMINSNNNSGSPESVARRMTSIPEGNRIVVNKDAVAVEIGNGDADDDKYARRPVNERIARIVNNSIEHASKAANRHEGVDVPNSLKKTGFLVLIIIMVVVALLEFWTRTKPNSSIPLTHIE